MSRIINKKTQTLAIDGEQAGRRIDNFLLGHFKTVPRSRVYRMLRCGEVRVNGGRIRQGYRLQEGDLVRIPPVRLVPRSEPAAVPDALLDRLKDCILYQDDNVLVIDKPSGLVVHSGSGRDFGVIELLRQRFGEELQLVHRLDQQTSGCLLLARNMPSLRRLHEVFQAAEIGKTYTALLAGVMRHQTQRVEAALNDGRMLSGERMVTVDEQGKPAVSHFRLLQKYADASQVSVRIETGRTHQIRVHARHIGHAVAGDKKYGDRDFNKRLRARGLKRLFLHAGELCFADPASGDEIRVVAPLPADLQAVLSACEG
ncbi:MAG: RluA family pseudouridine synthase [Gammaproteobacteria bacterium]